MMLEDAASYVRVQNIYNPANFDRSLRPAAEFIKEHSEKHKTLPDRTQISATTGVKLAAVPDWTKDTMSGSWPSLKRLLDDKNLNGPF